MRIALVRPACDYDEQEFQEPLGAEAICGYLRKRGLVCRVFDRMLGVKTADLTAYRPDWVGFSLLTESEVPDALRLLQLLRTPGRRFFAGGVFVTAEPARAAALFPMNTVLITGEGEKPVYDLVTTGEIHGTAPLEPDEWAFASRDDLSAYLARGGVVNLRTARGCHGGCTFCTTPGRRFEARSVDKVAAEMAAIARAGYEPIFNFTDDEFGDTARIQALERALTELGVRAAFSLELRAAEIIRTQPERWAALYAGGLCRVFTGLESLNAETLRRWGKPIDVPELLRALQSMRQAGIVCEVGYILWHGDTTAETAMQEAVRLYENGLLSPKTALSRLILFPGSRLYREAGAGRVQPVDLQPEAQALFSLWERLLAPLQSVWRKAALRMPGLSCRSFLSGETAACQALANCLTRIGELTWDTVRTRMPPDAEECRRLEEETDAICGTGQ